MLFDVLQRRFHLRKAFRSERRNLNSPVGVRLATINPAFNQRRNVGIEIPRCLQAAGNLIQGSSMESSLIIGLSFIYVLSGLAFRTHHSQAGDASIKEKKTGEQDAPSDGDTHPV